MKITKYQSDEERSILIGMIVNDRVLSRIFNHLKSERKPFRSKWCNLIAKWCLSFHEKYERAPRDSIESLFSDFAQTSKDEDTVALVEKFLSSLSDDYKAMSDELNEDHLIDLSGRHFNEVLLERLNKSIEADLVNKDVESAQERLKLFNPCNLSLSSMVDVLTDEEAWEDAVAEREDACLVRYPKALGQFFGNHLERDGFISFLAPEKRGKSFWLIDLAWRSSILNKRKTLLYSVGDMSQRQMMSRLIARTARRPLGVGQVRWPREVSKDDDGKPVIRWRSKAFDSRISFAEVKKAMERMRMKTASSSSLLKMRCTPNSSTTVADIRSDVGELARNGWVPDVVVIDYADILMPEIGTGSSDYRHQINETWKALRRLSQEFHILVVTATQSDAVGADTQLLTRKHFSEDKRKLSHVTGMIGLNQTEEEKRIGAFRLNWILLREGRYLESNTVTAAGNLELANPAMVSTW